MSEKVMKDLGYRIWDLGKKRRSERQENMDHKKIRCYKCKI